MRYQKLAERTEAKNFGVIAHRLFDSTEQGVQNLRLLHAAIGMCTEAGEFQDALKRAFFYGKPMDRTNLAEEVGDLLWYCALACNALNVDMEQIMRSNIKKLEKRFPAKFNKEDALIRDLKNERKELENEISPPFL